MQIYVTDIYAKEFIGNSREELTEDLYRTASEEYTADVLAWFDQGHEEPFKIQNGFDLETWTVIN